MENGINTPYQQSHNPISSAAGVNVLVVDDDVVCLSIVAGILRAWRYQVVTIKNPLDALATLQLGRNFFHLVVTDVHMPEMNGFEFQKRVQEEFHLPVVMMSADDTETSMLRGLESGAAFYIVKPVKYNDLRNIWQYAADKDKSDDNNHNVGAAPEEEPEPPAEEPPVERTLDNPINHKSGSSVRGANHETRREPKKRASKKVIIEESGNNNSDAVSHRRTKVVWTSALHNRFLEAVRKIGLERAVPKRILELMNTPGLTRENIASHLQKYRLFLRRVAEASNSNGTSKGKNTVERTLRSSFATGHPTLLLNALQKGYPQFLNQQLAGSLLLQGPLENIQPVHDPLFPNQQASTSNPIPQPGHGNGNEESNSVNNQANSEQLNQQQAQTRSNLAPTSMPSNILGVNTMTSFNSLPRNLDCSFNNNRPGSGLMGFGSNEMSSGFNGSYGSMFGNNGNAGYYTQGAGACSSVGFPPRFSNVTQQNGNSMMLRSPQLLQQNDIWNGGESSSYLLDHLMNTTAPMEGFSFTHFGENDIDDVFRGHFSNLYTNEAGEEVQSGAVNLINPVENNPPENQISSNQQMNFSGDMMGYFGNGVNQLDDYFLNFEPTNPNQATQQLGGGNYQQPSPYSGNPMSPAWNQDINSDFMDSMFGRGKY